MLSNHVVSFERIKYDDVEHTRSAAHKINMQFHVAMIRVFVFEIAH